MLDAEDAQGADLRSIAEASELLGVTQRTLRFYEDKGLIRPRRVGSMRVYSRREMGRMQLILRGKRLGFSIREIGEFLSLYDDGGGRIEQMRHLQSRINERLRELQDQRRAIEQTIDELVKMEGEAQDRIDALERGGD
ncbi:MerR family DNA-binding transcriptional regulator [Aurantiacibacter spongiae]|uniref:MerR family DNA-binding transcriptional regulator n=2 Tax=Aurantiacibacter spongiae TaxID=2488860 RepID=A0A3N5CTU7_9SPHN|nr:MerR family DNA-binding transcriptional regulator [Aurantiacibacter spongiae]